MSNIVTDLKGQSTGIAIGVLVIVIIVGGAVYYTQFREEGGMEVQNPNTLVNATAGGPQTLDPAWAYDTASGEVIFNVYEPLISFKGESLTEYDDRLATDWEISDDGTTYRFKIRDGATFHNGNELTPSDVEYSMERAMVLDRDGGPSWMLLEPLLGVGSTRSGGEISVDFEDIDDSVEVDGDWVVFNLDSPYPPFMDILTQSWSSIIDQDWAANQGAWPGTAETWEDYNNPESPPLQEVMNGTGPFEFDRWDKGVEVVMKRNADYWRDSAEIETVRIKYIEEWSTRKTMFLNGDADFCYVPRAHSEEVEGVEGIDIYKGLANMQTNPAVFYQYQINENSDWIGSGKLDGDGVPTDFFSDKHLRYAFSYAFDYETYIDDAFLGQGIKVPGPIPSAVRYFNPDQETFSHDLEKAEEEFKKAFGGSVEDPGPVWENGFTMTVLYNSGNTQRKLAAEIWESSVEQINDKFSIEIADRKWSTYLGEMVSGKLPVFIIGWIADYPDPHNFVYPFMHSNGTFSHWQGYSNSEVDDLIDQGISSTSSETREDVYYELQSIYHEDNPSVPLCEPTVRHYERSWVDGWFYNPIFPGDYYYTISKG